MIFKIIALIAFLSINSIEAAPHELPLADLATNLSSWMTLLPNELRQIPINFLAIPGSHDTFTVDITNSSHVAPDGEDILRELEFLDIVRTVLANWSKTQALTAVQQLEAGIRYFDLRICRNSDDDGLYFCHRMYSTEISGVLTDMASYLDNHPEEFVILDCQHFYNFTTSTHSEVIGLIKDTFGDKLTPYQENMDNLTLEFLASQGKQVLVIYREDAQTDQSLWPSTSLPNPWYNTMDWDYLSASLDSGLSTRSNSIAHVSQLILSPDLPDIIGGALSSLEQKCAVDFEKNRTEWLSNQTAGKNGINVVIVDFIDLNDNIFSKTVINLNQKVSLARFNDVDVFKNIKNFLYDLKSYMF